jgi:hypothetical protein
MQSACIAEMAFCGTTRENVAHSDENEGHLPSQASVFSLKIQLANLQL